VVFVALVDQLVGASDEGEVVHVVELNRSADEHTLGKRRMHTSVETLSPNSHPAPLGETAHVSTSSGSDQTRSQKAPS